MCQAYCFLDTDRGRALPFALTTACSHGRRMRIHDYVTPDRVLIGVRANDAAAALQAVATPLAASIGSASADTLYQALLAREQLHTTALDCGVAAPHATLEGVPQPVVLIATAAAPIGFGPARNEPVRLLFVLLSPPAQAGLHIRLLARIARIVRRPGLVEQLTDATSPAELLAHLADAEPQLA